MLGNSEGQLLGKANNYIYVRGLKGVAVGESVEIFRTTMHFARSYQGSTQRTATSSLNKRGDRIFVDGESFWKGTMTSPDSKDYIGTELMRVASGHVDGFVGESARVMVEKPLSDQPIPRRPSPLWELYLILNLGSRPR